MSHCDTVSTNNNSTIKLHQLCEVGY